MKCADGEKKLEEQGCDFFDDGNKWIPVSEKLPEEFAYVICSTDAKEVFLASYYGEDCFDDYEGLMRKGDVIAWMPSPEPYVPDINDGKMAESEAESRN